MNQLFAPGDQNTRASASALVLPESIQIIFTHPQKEMYSNFCTHRGDGGPERLTELSMLAGSPEQTSHLNPVIFLPHFLVLKYSIT